MVALLREMRKGDAYMFCKNCGRLLPDDEKICYSCGARVSGGLVLGKKTTERKNILPVVLVVVILTAGLMTVGMMAVRYFYDKEVAERKAIKKALIEELADENYEDEEYDMYEEEKYPEETGYIEEYAEADDTETSSDDSEDAFVEAVEEEEEEEDYIITQLRKIQTPDITVPYSAEVKTDTRISDLIGEYEGEIQFTLIKGFENMPGASEDVPDMVQAGLDAPSPCTLEIKEDGDWILFLDYMYGMTMTGSAYKIYDPQTPEEENAHLIHDIEDGRFYVMTIVEGDGNYGRVENNGICCEQYGKKVIYGYFRADLIMSGTTVVLAGFYTVYAE